MCFPNPNTNASGFYSDLPTSATGAAPSFDDNSSANDLWSAAERDTASAFESARSRSPYGFPNDDAIEPLRVELPTTPTQGGLLLHQEQYRNAAHSGSFAANDDVLGSSQSNYQAATTHQHSFDNQGRGTHSFPRYDYQHSYQTSSGGDLFPIDNRSNGTNIPNRFDSHPWNGDGMIEVNGGKCSGDKTFVDHTYIDFSSVNDRIIHERSSFVGETLQSIVIKGGATDPDDVVTVEPVTNRGTRTFPKKLMEMLSVPMISHCLTWLPHGRSFIVNNPDEFMTEVYPRFFKATQYKSFLRQLNLWGFKRITKGNDSGAYYHQFFLRGMPNLVKKMTLVRIKGGSRPMPNPEGEPDFYALALLRPLPSS